MGCTSNNNLSTTLIDPTAGTTAVISGSTTIEQGQSANIMVAITGGTGSYTVVYNNGSIDATANSYDSEDNITVMPNSTTTYTLTSVTDSKNCLIPNTGYSGSAMITVNSSSCPSTLDVTSTTDNTTYNASNTLTSNIAIPDAHEVIFEAGQSITLGVGFSKKGIVNGTFTARIANCNPLITPTMPSSARITSPISNPLIDQSTMAIHPNPAKELLNVNYQLGAISTIQIGLYDLTGKRIVEIVPKQTQDKGTFQERFLLSALEPGMYFVILQTEKERISKKLIIIR